MIEKLGTKETKYVSTPCKLVLEYLEALLFSTQEPISICEVGIGYGATSTEIVKRLRKNDSFYFYSYQEDVDELYQDLKTADYCKCNLFPYGNSHKPLDAYYWPMAKEILEYNFTNTYDLVYLDGAHNFIFSGMETVLLKNMIKEGGCIIFDDINWSYGRADKASLDFDPTELFTDEQINKQQVKMVTQILMDKDKDWELIFKSERQSAYEKRTSLSQIVFPSILEIYKTYNLIEEHINSLAISSFNAHIEKEKLEKFINLVNSAIFKLNNLMCYLNENKIETIKLKFIELIKTHPFTDQIKKENACIQAFLENTAVIQSHLWGKYRTHSQCMQMFKNWILFLHDNKNQIPKYKKSYFAFLNNINKYYTEWNTSSQKLKCKIYNTKVLKFNFLLQYHLAKIKKAHKW